MAGHSKWSNIKRKKGVIDAKRGQVFTRLSRNITVAAQEGGVDPDSNFMLRMAIDQAKAANMPSDNIAKAVKKGSGELSEGKLVNVIYEAQVVGGVAMLIHCQSDNTNRTVTEVRQIVEFKHAGKISPGGSLNWRFTEVGVIMIRPEIYMPPERFGKEGTYSAVDIDNLSLELLELPGLIDLSTVDEEGIAHIQLVIEKPEFAKVNKSIDSKGYHIVSSEVVWLPNETVTLSAEQVLKLNDLIEELEDYPDVANVWHNGVE